MDICPLQVTLIMVRPQASVARIMVPVECTNLSSAWTITSSAPLSASVPAKERAQKQISSVLIMEFMPPRFSRLLSTGLIS
ncbi:hypothetical protein D3C76_1402250 [compost metagenome]